MTTFNGGGISMQKEGDAVCCVFAEQIERGERHKHFWLYWMARVPQIGERIDGSELENQGTQWKVRLVIQDEHLLAMVRAFWAMDRVADQGSGFIEGFRDLLEALLSKKRVI